MSDSDFRTHDGRTLDQAASDLVQREVLCCMSSMVSTLSQSYGQLHAPAGELASLCDQASELTFPVLDYEGAAREAGFVQSDAEHGAIGKPADLDAGDFDATHETWWAACEAEGIEPHELEVYEHWAVSTWLAEKLTAAGERVDTDFAGLNVWARTTTGQAISADAVVERITRELHAA